jgi:hypothetical protein
MAEVNSTCRSSRTENTRYDRRTLLKGSVAAGLLIALPVQLPAVSRRQDRMVAGRRYRMLRRLLRQHPSLAALVAPATRPGGYLRLSVTYRARRRAWLVTAEAQEPIALEPIQVIAPLSFDNYVETSGFNFASQNANGRLLQYNSYINYYLPMIAAQNAAAQAAADQAALVNVMVVPPPEPEPIIIPPVVEPEPEAAPEPSFTDPLFNNPYSQYVASALRDVGLDITEAMAVAFLIEGSATALEFALPPIYATASQLIAEGLAAGTIAARIGLLATGVTVGLSGAGLALASLAVVGITLYYVVPEIERARRTNLSDFTGEISVEAMPLVVEPPSVSAEPELLPYIPDGAPISQEESESLYPGYNWYWDVQTQAWVYFGE